MQWAMRISSVSSGDLAAHDGIEANAGYDNQRAKVESRGEVFMFLKK